MLKILRQTVLGALMLLASLPLAAQDKAEEKDSLVRLMSAQSAQIVVERGITYRKVFGPARFLHNDTYLICDTAWWNVDQGLIKALGNVKILQDETELTGDQLDYIIDEDLAQFRGGVVQLKDKDNNLLRTSHLDYNTKDSVAVFDHGGAMKDKDGQVIESVRGTYDAKIKLFTFEHDVNMFTDSVFVKTSRLEYSSPDSRATFSYNTNAWKEDNMLSADAGWFKREEDRFFFTRKVHIMTATQEGWCDSLYYHRPSGQVDMFGHAEVADTVREFNAIAGHISYVDSLQLVRLVRDPAIRALSGEQDRKDTSWIAGDVLTYWTVPRCDVDSMEVVHSGERINDIMSDPVGEYRRKAAEAAEKARADAQAQKDKEDGVPTAMPQGKGKGAGGSALAAEIPGGAGAVEKPGGSAAAEKPVESTSDRPPMQDVPGRAMPDSLGRSMPDSLGRAMPDSLGRSMPDSLGRAMPDSLGRALPDSLSRDLPDGLASPADSLAAAADSLATVVPAEPKDSTKIGFMVGTGRVRVFRRDIQVVCDSLAFTELDSLVRLYRRPVIWNEGNRQYSADSVAVLIRNESIDRASLMSNSFVAIEEDTLHYDQIKSTEMLAFFDAEGALKRFDALGGANALFYLEENGSLATVNAVDTKMMSVIFRDGELDRIHYFESVKNDAYPTVQLPADQKHLKGFEWRGSEKPSDPRELMPTDPRTTQRKMYESRPRAKFTFTDKYFPGYMAKVSKALAEEKQKRERRRREREERERMEADSIARAQEIAAQDSLKLRDVPELGDSLALQADSLSKAITVDDVTVPKDSLLTVVTPEVADTVGNPSAVTPSVLTPEEQKAADKAAREAEKAAKKAEAELRRKAKEAEREAKWIYLDSLDKVKADAKEQKRLEKIRRRNEKAARKEQKRLEREQRLFEKYKARYERRKAKEEARAAAKASSEVAKKEDAPTPEPSETRYSESPSTQP